MLNNCGINWVITLNFSVFFRQSAKGTVIFVKSFKKRILNPTTPEIDFVFFAFSKTGNFQSPLFYSVLKKSFRKILHSLHYTLFPFSKTIDLILAEIN